MSTLRIFRWIASLGAAVVLLCTAGCGSFNAGCGAGYRVDHPGLEITSVTDGRTGAPLTGIVLNDIIVSEYHVTDASYLIRQGLAYGVTADGSRLVGQVPFAFDSASPGGIRYRFIITATGYQPKAVDVRGGGKFNDGPCPMFSVANTQVQFVLTPL